MFSGTACPRLITMPELIQWSCLVSFSTPLCHVRLHVHTIGLRCLYTLCRLNDGLCSRCIIGLPCCFLAPSCVIILIHRFPISSLQLHSRWTGNTSLNLPVRLWNGVITHECSFAWHRLASLGMVVQLCSDALAATNLDSHWWKAALTCGNSQLIWSFSNVAVRR